MAEQETKLPFPVPPGLKEKKDSHPNSTLLSIRVTNAFKDAVDAAAKTAGESRNGFIVRTLRERIGFEEK